MKSEWKDLIKEILYIILLLILILIGVSGALGIAVQVLREIVGG